jgi:starch-binding outer membrane protein, SusD/RagB family
VPNKGDNPDGYYRVNWLLSLWNTTTNAPADYIGRQWRGYSDQTGAAPLRYILPVHSSVVTSSLGSVSNAGQYGY